LGKKRGPSRAGKALRVGKAERKKKTGGATTILGEWTKQELLRKKLAQMSQLGDTDKDMGHENATDEDRSGKKRIQEGPQQS